MKIIEIIPQLSQGGAERFCVDLSNYLAHCNDVILIVLHNVDQNSIMYRDLSPKVKLIVLNKKKGIDLLMFRKLHKIFRKEKPDVVHSHLRAIIYMFFAAMFMRSSKYIHTIHNDAEKESGGKLGLMIRKILLKRLVMPVTISKMSQLSFYELYGYKNRLIYNGAIPYNKTEYYLKVKEWFQSIRSKPETKVVLNVARINAQKNQLALVNAIANLQKIGYDIQLVIIGDKQDKQICNAIEAYNYPFVHLLGAKTNPKDYMDLADCFCLSSIYEGLPISLIECFSAGCLPICTPVGGVVDLIENEKNGILARGTSVADIENALSIYLNLSIDKVNEMKRLSLETYSFYSMQSCSEQYEKLMQEVCKK